MIVHHLFAAAYAHPLVFYLDAYFPICFYLSLAEGLVNRVVISIRFIHFSSVVVIAVIHFSNPKTHPPIVVCNSLDCRWPRRFKRCVQLVPLGKVRAGIDS